MAPPRRRVVIAYALSLASLLSGIADAQPKGPSVCKELLPLLSAPIGEGIERRVLDSSLPIGGQEDGIDRYFNLDVDGDDVNDVVTRSCSPSTTPADPCILEVQTSSGTKYTFEEWRFFLIRHKGAIYAVSSELGPKRKRGTGKIFKLGARGVENVCSGL